MVQDDLGNEIVVLLTRVITRTWNQRTQPYRACDYELPWNLHIFKNFAAGYSKVSFDRKFLPPY